MYPMVETDYWWTVRMGYASVGQYCGQDCKTLNDVVGRKLSMATKERSNHTLAGTSDVTKSRMATGFEQRSLTMRPSTIETGR